MLQAGNFSDSDMKRGAHKCPECGSRLPFRKFFNLPGDYGIECPECKTKLQPELNDFHRIVPWIAGIIVIIVAMNRKSGLTDFLVLIGILTLVTYFILMAAAYWFLRFRKSEEEE